MPSFRKTSTKRPAYGPDDVKVDIGQAIRDLNASSFSNSSGNADGAYDIGQSRNFAGALGELRPAGTPSSGSEEETGDDDTESGTIHLASVNDEGDTYYTPDGNTLHFSVTANEGIEVYITYPLRNGGRDGITLRNGGSSSVRVSGGNKLWIRATALAIIGHDDVEDADATVEIS